jgi:hypothetical protein
VIKDKKVIGYWRDTLEDTDVDLPFIPELAPFSVETEEDV